MKKMFKIAFLLVGLLIPGAVQNLQAATRTVDNTSDNDSLTACTSAPNDCSLRGAIAASAAAGDTINFDQSVVFATAQTVQLTSTLTISKSLLISGSQRQLLTIAGNPNPLPTGFAVFTINSGVTVEIRDLTIANGVGGVITSSNTNLTRVVITGNRHSGVHIVPPGNATIVDSTISNNQAVQGGGIYLAAQSLGDFARAGVNRTTISGNTVTQAGGGIYNNGILWLDNSTVSGNRSGTFGGGIYGPGSAFDNSGGHINYSTITNNQAGSAGGGLFSFDGRRMIVANSIIAGNTNNGNSSPNIANSFISEGFNLVGTTTGSSGYIATDTTNANPQMSALANNGGLNQTHALSCTSPALGGANPAFFHTVDQRGGVRPANGAPDIGAYEGNCVYNGNNGGLGSLRQSIADAPDGGAIHFDPTFFDQPRTIQTNGGGQDFFKNLTILGPGPNLLTIDGQNLSRIFNIDNATLNLSGIRLTRGYPGPNINGGAILINGNGTLNATNVVIDESRAREGAGIYVVGTLNLTNSTIADCEADIGGAGIRNPLNSTTTITGSIITGNHADDFGGGIGNSGLLTVRTTTVSGNSAARPPNSGGPPAGGGILNEGNLTLRDSTLLNNSAQLGGALLNRHANLEGYSEIRNTTFVGNTAVQTGNGTEVNGGAIYADGTHLGGLTATVDVVNITMVGNSAGLSGGGIFMQQFPGNHPVLNLHNSIIAGNTAGNGPDMAGQITSYGYNLIDTISGSSWSPSSPSLTGNIIGPPGGARLAPLGNYGGLTQTLPPMPNSPAIDNGNPGVFIPTDQRGAGRPAGGRGDIGAVERNIAFNQTTLPNASRNFGYHQELSAVRMNSLAENIAPTRFSLVPVAGQQLPPGITLSSTGLLSGTPTTLGTYAFTVQATDTDGIAGVQEFSIQVLVPTAAGLSVSGRVLTANGAGIAKVIVTLTDARGISRTAGTGTFGYYSFDNITAGETVVITVTAKRFRFDAPTRIINVTDNVNNMDFVALE